MRFCCWLGLISRMSCCNRHSAPSGLSCSKGVEWTERTEEGGARAWRGGGRHSRGRMRGLGKAPKHMWWIASPTKKLKATTQGQPWRRHAGFSEQQLLPAAEAEEALVGRRCTPQDSTPNNHTTPCRPFRLVRCTTFFLFEQCESAVSSISGAGSNLSASCPNAAKSHSSLSLPDYWRRWNLDVLY
jgi:hypothetical protein